MTLRILMIISLYFFSQSGYAFKDQNETTRTFKGFISATLNSDKHINQQMFIREYFNKLDPENKYFQFTGDKSPDVGYRLWFKIFNLSGELFEVNIILESKKRGESDNWKVVYNETVSGVLYGNNKYDLSKNGLPSLNIDIEIDKNFTADELKERFNQ